MRDHERFTRDWVSCLKQDFRDGGGFAGSGALVRAFTRDHESFTRDWVSSLKQDLQDFMDFQDAGGLAGTGSLV